MFLQQTLEVIDAFLNRYTRYVTECGDYTKITTIEDKVEFTFTNYLGSSYTLTAWISEGELHIENNRGESVFDYAEENEWHETDVRFIKYGPATKMKIPLERMTREERLEKALEVAADLSRHYSYERYSMLYEICGDVVDFYEGSMNDFFIEDEHFFHIARYTDYCTCYYDEDKKEVVFYDEIEEEEIDTWHVKTKEEAESIMKEWITGAPSHIICQKLGDTQLTD